MLWIGRPADQAGRAGSRHESLPGDSFVFIDTSGTQRWHGEYPSMWLSPLDLHKQVEKHVPSA